MTLEEKIALLVHECSFFCRDPELQHEVRALRASLEGDPNATRC